MSTSISQSKLEYHSISIPGFYIKLQEISVRVILLLYGILWPAKPTEDISVRCLHSSPVAVSVGQNTSRQTGQYLAQNPPVTEVT